MSFLGVNYGYLPSLGDIVNTAVDGFCKSTGMDEKNADLLGDLAGAFVDFNTGNPAGALDNLYEAGQKVDLAEAFASGTVGSKAGAGKPAPGSDDADAWSEWAKDASYEDIRAAVMNGEIPGDVLGDPRFSLILQEKKGSHDLAMQTLSGLLKSEHDVAVSIIRNTFA